MLRALHRVMNAQRMVVEAHPELEVARRKGLTYWRDRFGAVTIKEVYTHLRRCELIAALRASGTLFWYARTRLLVLPWKHRKRVWKFVARSIGLRQHAGRGGGGGSAQTDNPAVSGPDS